MIEREEVGLLGACYLLQMLAEKQATDPNGKFQLIVDGKKIDTVFGTKGTEWAWQDGGTIEPERRDDLVDEQRRRLEARAVAVAVVLDPLEHLAAYVFPPKLTKRGHAEVGKHAQLMQQGGLYSQLYQRQMDLTAA